MEWVLLVIMAGTPSNMALHSTTVPMATAERCNAAQDKLISAIKVYQSPNYTVIAECLQSR